MRKLSLLVALAIGLATTAHAQGPATMAFNSSAYPGGIHGDSLAIAAQVLDSARSYESGVYRVDYAFLCVTAGSGGTNPRDSVVFTYPNGISTITIATPGEAETVSAGTILTGSSVMYVSTATTGVITWAVVDGGTQGTHMQFALYIRLERLY